MTKEEIIAKVKEVAAAPCCYAGLKEVCDKYVAALNTADEAAAAKELVAALEDSVQSIDDVIPFFASDTAKNLFGAEQAAAMLAQANEVKANGGDTCFCPACTAGKVVLDNKSAIL